MIKKIILQQQIIITIIMKRNKLHTADLEDEDLESPTEDLLPPGDGMLVASCAVTIFKQKFTSLYHSCLPIFRKTIILV